MNFKSESEVFWFVVAEDCKPLQVVWNVTHDDDAHALAFAFVCLRPWLGNGKAIDRRHTTKKKKEARKGPLVWC